MWAKSSFHNSRRSSAKNLQNSNEKEREFSVPHDYLHALASEEKFHPKDVNIERFSIPRESIRKSADMDPGKI